jgi:two-component system, NtrC family, sensor kinase
MKKESHWLEKLLPSPAENDQSDAGSAHGYTRFSRGLSVILMILVLVPLTVVSLVSHHQYKQLLEEEEMDQLVLNLEGAKNTIETFISELQSVIKFVARDDRYQELLDPEELEALFVRLQNEYTGFADIEIIDSTGTQKAYFGPYTLEERSYTEQNWYKEVLLHGVYISNIFSGFRNVPHFVIAVSRQHPEGRGHWVLRVTIDGKTLQHFINTIRTSYADDMFLVDRDGITQTTPQKYGKIGDKCVLHGVIETAVNHIRVNQQGKDDTSSGMTIVKKAFNGQQINHAAIELLNTPWKLVLVKEQYLHANTWVQFKIKLTTMFFSCVIIAVFIILEISTAITSHIRESDKRRQQLYREAENSNKLASIGRLAAGVAHEINNPLAIINQKAGLVQDFMEFSDDFPQKDPVGEALSGIQDSVERCKTITHRLLGFARQTDVNTEEIDVNDTIREVVDFLAKEAAYNQIRIEFDLTQDIEKVWSARGPLQQVLLNITNNAIDAIGSGGTIKLTSRQINKNTIQLTIVDDGPGMPSEVLQHIFEPFFTTKETGKGTGLGLSITYGLVKKLGGSIKVKSKIGTGTIFRITLPVRQSDYSSSQTN